VIAVTLAGATLTDRGVTELLRSYEGLIHKTALMLVNGEPPYGPPVEDDLEDVVQVLSVKAWKAILAFDPARWKGGQGTRHAAHAAKSARDRYVNMCLRDQAKDLCKKKRRGELHIEDVAPAAHSQSATGQSPRDKFDQRYLSADHEQIYGGVEDEDLLLPNTLTEREREVVELMGRHYRQTEIADLLGVSKREVEKAVRSIRIKLADWRPDGSEAAGDECGGHELAQAGEARR
jgi:RNA polymerase sigma factor (sigma-70 family)